MMSWLIGFADLFFLSLWPSLLWAAAIGLASAFAGWRGRMLTLLLALLPMAASAFYFGLAHASDESFLLAGVIPWSDAAMHFRQAAQMAFDGITHTGMNGRFLYPAYFSSLLNLSSGNLLLAEMLGTLFFAAALALTLRVVACFFAAPGAALVALVSWLFFRERCAGLIMTENLGLLCGLLSLSALLLATPRRSLFFYLLGIFLLAFGLAARPGALFVLPLLVFYMGWFGKKEWKANLSPALRSCLAAALAIVMILVAFGSNTLLLRTLYEGKVIANQNFSFTLYGMLTGGKWSDNLVWSHWNSQLVMQENIHLMRAHPQLLLWGAARVYQEALSRRILFMFHHESRPATMLLILAVLGLVALWKKKRLRPFAPWLSLIALGILLSIPFVPPWDAAERPFAATVPFQAILAAIGFFAVCQFLIGKKGERVCSLFEEPGSKTCERLLIFLALLVFVLTVPFPIVHQRMTTPRAFIHEDSSVEWRTGSFVSVTPETSLRLHQRMIPFLASYPNEASLFSKLPEHYILGIDWRSKNFDRCILLDRVGETRSFQGWRVDLSLRDVIAQRSR